MPSTIEQTDDKLVNGTKAESAASNGVVTKKEADGTQAYRPPGMKCSVVNLYEGEKDRRGKISWTSTYPNDLEEPPENAESAQHALLIRNRKCYDGRKKLSIDSIVVQSPLLKEMLGDVLERYPGVTTDLQRLEFSSPFEPFVHRWERLVEAKDKQTDPEAKAHVDLLFNVLEAELDDTIREKNDHIAHGVVVFDKIWAVFEPGTCVWSEDEGHDRAYRLKSGNYAQTRCGQVYALHCEFVDFDGENFGYGTETLQIPAFHGTAPIARLSSMPLQYHPNADTLKKGLIARGRLFEAYKGYHYKGYEGIGIGFGCFGQTIRYSVNSRIIIDTYAYNRFNPNRKVNLSYLRPADRVSDDEDSESEDDMEWLEPDEKQHSSHVISSSLSTEDLLICTASLRGYSLKDKKWLLFFLNSVKEIVWNEHAFESLVAPEEQKQLILAFAQSQAKHAQLFDDVIQGKGRGIIMLLSGPPGVGKTLTAESVAETMKSALANILEMNTKWNAVLLLDEADVFLEARSAHDLERNKLVSIFLRLLEYYEGILFLTTNRVDNIDAAFESRIHLSLQYGELDAASRRHVWAAFLKRSAASAGAGMFGEAELDKLAEVQLNGRQIKNVLKTAQLLASQQGKELAFEHVDVVLKLRAANARRT